MVNINEIKKNIEMAFIRETQNIDEFKINSENLQKLERTRNFYLGYTTCLLVEGQITIDNYKELLLVIEVEEINAVDIIVSLGLIQDEEQKPTTPKDPEPQKNPCKTKKSKGHKKHKTHKHLKEEDKSKLLQEYNNWISLGFTRSKVYGIIADKFGISWTSARRHVLIQLNK